MGWGIPLEESKALMIGKLLLEKKLIPGWGIPSELQWLRDSFY